MTRWQYKYEELEKKYKKLVNHLVGYQDSLKGQRNNKADALFILTKIIKDNEPLN